MIITRTPLRISLGGGGTDIPTYYRTNDHGFLVAASITKYVYIAVNANFNKGFLLRYSEVERASTIDAIRHPLMRECIRATNTPNRVEITSIADLPAGTGLGSSGSFAVGALKALHQFANKSHSAEFLAQQACDIEMNVLCEATGKQDQYIAAVGGITAITFRDDESVRTERLDIEGSIVSRLEENLLLFFTGIKRSASESLVSEQKFGSSAEELRENLSDTRAIGYETRNMLERGDLKSFGRLLTEQWMLKFRRQPSPFHQDVNKWIESGISAGAVGGKLVGAGGGGFLLFYADQKDGLRDAMAKLGFEEVTFGFDFEGAAFAVSR